MEAGVEPEETREHGRAGQGGGAADELGGSGVAAHGGEETGELQAEEDEGDAGEPAGEKAREGEGGPAGCEVQAHGLAPTRAEAGGDDGQHAGDVAGFGREAGGETEGGATR